MLGAAVVHAVWNSIVHAMPERLVGFYLVGPANSLGGGAIAAITGLPTPRGRLFPASAVIHVRYNLALMASYRLA